MPQKHLSYYLAHLREDIPAGLVVFLVALPLCLGIALASGAPAFSGVIAGIVGGLIVGVLSGSELSVSGPAAGLTVIVAGAIGKLGFSGLLLAVTLAGVFQIAMGYLRAGVIGAWLPSSVIKAMLASIGIILILKQLPHAVGYQTGADDLSFLEANSHWAVRLIWEALQSFSPAATIISCVSLAIMIAWDTSFIREEKWLKAIPGPLVAVCFGVAFQFATSRLAPALSLSQEQLVTLPQISLDGVASLLVTPDIDQWSRPEVWIAAATLAVVASLETLLSLEAVEKLDPLKRAANADRELKAQGVGNLVSGLLGGLPITAVIVRSSANIDAGGRTKAACFTHGVLLLVSVLFLSPLLNLIPLSCLAAVLLITGFKLAHPKHFIEAYRNGFDQFTPFLITVVAILATDLLKGMIVGMAAGLLFVVRANHRSAITLTRENRHYLLRLQKDVSFLNKALLRQYLESVEEGSYVIIDGARASFVDHDILETLEDFLKAAPEDNIEVELRNIRGLTSGRPGNVWTPSQAPEAAGVMTAQRPR